MTDASFAPVLYIKRNCPFCLKARIFLLEAGLLAKFEVKEFSAGTDDERIIKDELAPHFDKLSFPSSQVSPGRYIKDSDAIIAHFAADAKLDPSKMPVLSAYVSGAFQQLFDLYKENMEMKKRLDS